MSKFKNNVQLKGMLLTAGVVLLSLFVVFAVDGFFPFGNGSVAALDLNSQYIPLLYRFYDVVTGSKNIAVDLHIGGGINLFSDTVTELVNPFNYVLLLFGRANIYKAVNILLVLYVMAASLASYYVLGKVSRVTNEYLKVALAVSYGMSYFVAYQYEIIRWMYIVVLFPFLFLALKKMLTEEKSLAFILLLTYILVLSLQLGIQITMFTFVYSVAYLWGEKREAKAAGTELKGIAHKCLIVGLSFISAVLLAAPSEIPAVMNISSSARSTQNSSILAVITHHGFNNILERILEICNPVVIGLLIAIVFVHKKNAFNAIKKQWTVVVSMLVLIVTALLEPANLLWHLGSYQCFPVRYGYIVVWLGIVLVAELIAELGTSNGSEEKKNSGKWKIYLADAAGAVICIGLIGFVFVKRLMFAQAFATLDISGVCKKETVLLYGIVFAVAVIAAVIYLLRDCGKFGFIKLIVISAVMGTIWFMAVLWPQSSEARVINEANYRQMNTSPDTNKASVYAGHVSENDNEPLNAALVNGTYSMSAYMPSGESKEYVNTMNKLGYETPWISVAARGGSELSNSLLGIEGDFKGAMGVTAEEYDDIKIISDFSVLLASKQPLTMTFNNRKGTVSISGIEQSADYILLPMAYVKGWRTDNGEITNYLGGLLAVKLYGNAGEILLDYSVPGIGAGCLMAVAGIIVILLLLFVFKKETVLDKLAAVVYVTVLILFVTIVYVISGLGLVTYIGAKAVGKDIAPYLEISKRDNGAVHTLLSQTVEDDGIHVLIGRNNLMNDKGVKVTASDEESGYFRASKVADGNFEKESRWSSENNWDNNEHFLQADFKTSRNIKAVKIYWERTNATNYSIEVSKDGTNWTSASVFEEAAETNPQIIYYEDGIEARFVRLHVTGVRKEEADASLYYQNVSICEMEVYDDECDSFVVETPVLSDGTNRHVPVPKVPDGYSLKIGGINYDNLLTSGNHFADTISDVNINLGYELYCGNEGWDLKGFDIVLPASEAGDEDKFDFRDVSVREWRRENGNLNFSGKETLVQSLETRTDNSALKVSVESNEALGDEGYQIEIKDDRILLTAQNEKGIYWGRVTLSHMIKENADSWKCGIIRDYPEYAVRGFVLDVARRPFTMEMLYRMLDELADNYMNTFQIHLSDNAIISISDYDGTVEGARELFSAYRLESNITKGDMSLTSEFHYTDEEFRKFIADAKAMGIDVVPEIDTPAHSMAVTKMFPELGFDNYPELADTMDASKPEVLTFATNLWGQYLGKNALFEECNVLHLGADEYYGDTASYAKYLANLSSAVKKMANDKELRVWGSISYNEMDTSAIDKNLQMMVWSTVWSDPMDTYNCGFGIINCINSNLYIVVGSGNDYLDMDNLKDRWEPNLFYDSQTEEVELPAWSPRMLGACYSMWNENYCSGVDKTDDEGIYSRFSEPMGVLSDKLWNRD